MSCSGTYVQGGWTKFIYSSGIHFCSAMSRMLWKNMGCPIMGTGVPFKRCCTSSSGAKPFCVEGASMLCGGSQLPRVPVLQGLIAHFDSHGRMLQASSLSPVCAIPSRDPASGTCPRRTANQWSGFGSHVTCPECMAFFCGRSLSWNPEPDAVGIRKSTAYMYMLTTTQLPSSI